MSFKVYTKGNYFYIINNDDNREYNALSKDVLITRGTTSQDDFFIENVDNWRGAENPLDITVIQDENGDAYSVTSFITFYESNTGQLTSSSNEPNNAVNLATNDLGRDAWGRPKTITDSSIFHGMFSFNIPVTTWYERFNDVEQAFTNCTSVNGALHIVAGATLNDKTNLRAFRHPKYETNRGYLYSTAGWFTNPSSLMNRRFGAGTDENAVFFSLESGTLYAVVRTTRGGITTEDKNAITLPSGVDLSKGNVFDIQFQWRGVGDYKFFINLEEVYNTEYLGTLSELSMSNPALPAFFESENLGGNDEMEFGCVDITSEGGKERGKTYGSVGIDNESGQVAISGFNTPIVAIRSKTTVNTLINTRDTFALLASAYADQRAFFRVWATRDFTDITDGTQTWSDFGDGHLEYIQYDAGAVTSMTFDTTGLIPVFGCRVDQDNTYSTSALFEGRTNIYLTPGDMFVFTMHRETGGATKVGVTFEFAEEI